MSDKELVADLIKRTGKSLSVVKKAVKKAKEVTADSFNAPEESWMQTEYDFFVQSAEKILGLEEAKTLDSTAGLVDTFSRSNRSALDYIEETVTSGSFSFSGGSYKKPEPDEEDEKIFAGIPGNKLEELNEAIESEGLDAACLDQFDAMIDSEVGR